MGVKHLSYTGLIRQEMPDIICHATKNTHRVIQSDITPRPIELSKFFYLQVTRIIRLHRMFCLRRWGY